MSGKTRKIIHIDMDMFFAAVEIRDNPGLAKKPVVIGGKPNTRSVVSTANYEARKFGIHSAMSCAEAYKRCPACVFLPPNFHKYKEESQKIRDIFYSYTDLVEPMSLDEAYLDVTENKVNEPSATKIAKAIKQKIFKATGLTASAGVAPNKFIAKIASDYYKPDGLCVVPPSKVMEFLKGLPVIKVPGIGKVTNEHLARMGIKTITDLQKKREDFLIASFGKFGRYLHKISQGIDDSPVVTDYERQSYGTEETFDKDILDVEKLLDHLQSCSEYILRSLRKQNLKARTVTLKIKYHDFQAVTRRITYDDFIETEAELFEAVKYLIEKTEAGRKEVRLAGVSLSSFDEKEEGIPGQLYFPFYKEKGKSLEMRYNHSVIK